MRKKILPLIKWLLPLPCLIVGLVFILAFTGRSFLGIACLCCAGVLWLYLLLGLLHTKMPRTADIAHTVLTVLLCLFLLAFAVTEVFILRSATIAPEADCQYVLVLGAKVNDNRPSASLQDRIHVACAYLNANPNAIAILTGGQGADETMTEARCIYNALVSMSINPDRLWLEEKATSTWENIDFSLDLIESKTGTRPQQVGILSSEYHMFRAKLFAKEQGVEAVGIPATTSSPTIKLNNFLREAGGVWYYMVLGGH